MPLLNRAPARRVMKRALPDGRMLIITEDGWVAIEDWLAGRLYNIARDNVGHRIDATGVRLSLSGIPATGRK